MNPGQFKLKKNLVIYEDLDRFYRIMMRENGLASPWVVDKFKLFLVKPYAVFQWYNLTYADRWQYEKKIFFFLVHESIHAEYKDG